MTKAGKHTQNFCVCFKYIFENLEGGGIFFFPKGLGFLNIFRNTHSYFVCVFLGDGKGGLKPQSIFKPGKR